MKRVFRSPFTGLVGSLLLLVLIDVYLLPGSFGYLELRPSPFLLLSVLLSATYGLRMAFIASGLCSLTFLLLVHFNINYQEVETIFDLAYLSIPLGLTVLSIVIGELKQRSIDRIRALHGDIRELHKTREVLKNKESMFEKEVSELKKRLVSKLETARSFYDIATSFQTLDESELLENFQTAIGKVFKTNKVTLSLAADPATLDSLSLEAYRLERQVTLKDIFSLKSFEGQAQNVQLAIPIIVQGKVEFVVQVSGILFLEYVPTNFKLSELYTQWLSSALMHARQYRSLQKSHIWNDALQVYQYNFFRDRISEEFNRSKTYSLPLTVLRVRIGSLNQLSFQKAQTVRKIVTSLLSKSIRKLDYVTEGETSDEFFVIFPILDATTSEFMVQEVERELKLLNVRSETGVVMLETQMREFDPAMESVDELIGATG